MLSLTAVQLSSVRILLLIYETDDNTKTRENRPKIHGDLRHSFVHTVGCPQMNCRAQTQK